MTPAGVVFWISLLVSLYLYLGYPTLLLLLSRLRARPIQCDSPARLSVSMIVPAYNEEQVVGKKVANSLALDFPPDRLEILVVSDGSTDGTEDAVRRIGEERVRVISLPRSGKAFALNEGARQARGEILVFTDANAFLEAKALDHIVKPFVDEAVGGVCGNKKYRAGEGSDATAEGEGLYWRFDTWQKKMESSIGSIFAADGTLYAVRKRLYVPIEEPAQADDIAISARVVLQGYRLIHEPRAVAFEDPPGEGREEFRRKIRVTNHSLRALWNLGTPLWTSGFYSVELLSHKFFRHLAPFFLIALFSSSLFLIPGHPVIGSLFALQLTFYVLALIGFALRGARPGRWRLLSIPYYFLLVNAAAFVGVLSILKGERPAKWVPRQGLKP